VAFNDETFVYVIRLSKNVENLDFHQPIYPYFIVVHACSSTSPDALNAYRSSAGNKFLCAVMIIAVGWNSVFPKN